MPRRCQSVRCTGSSRKACLMSTLAIRVPWPCFWISHMVLQWEFLPLDVVIGVTSCCWSKGSVAGAALVWFAAGQNWAGCIGCHAGCSRGTASCRAASSQGNTSCRAGCFRGTASCRAGCDTTWAACHCCGVCLGYAGSATGCWMGRVLLLAKGAALVCDYSSNPMRDS